MSAGFLDIVAASVDDRSDLFLSLQLARPGSFQIAPSAGMLDALRRDYQAMQGMIFGEVPKSDAVVDAIRLLEKQVNRTK